VDDAALVYLVLIALFRIFFRSVFLVKIVSEGVTTKLGAVTVGVYPSVFELYLSLWLTLVSHFVGFAIGGRLVGGLVTITAVKAGGGVWMIGFFVVEV
jgi:hypothetical protein